MIKGSFKINTRLAILLSENYRSPENVLKELIDNAGMQRYESSYQWLLHEGAAV